MSVDQRPQGPDASDEHEAVYRRAFVTRHQLSGWRFVLRRLSSGIALHDTRMIFDPLRTQSRAVTTGWLVVATALVGAVVFSIINPSTAVGTNTVLADRKSAALYVRINDQLHPVLNLTSARLATGQDVDPVQVRSAELDKFARGATIGIPGAPDRLVQASSHDGQWTVCDGARPGQVGVTVIAGSTATGGQRATDLSADSAVLADNGNGTWLLWHGRRSAIDLGDRVVTSALGLGGVPLAPRPIATGLFNAIPEGAPLRAPAIAGAGTPVKFALPVPAPIGSVVRSSRADGTALYYAVLPDGLQQISPVLAAVLRSADSYGLQAPPQLTADQIARFPVSLLLDTDAFPEHPVTIVDPAQAPVTCIHWSKPAGATSSSQRLLSGAALPVADGVHAVDLVNSGGARSAVLPPGTGYFVQTVGQEPNSPAAGSLFWISDTGVRFGIDGGTGKDGTDKTVAALGLTEPALPIPWSVLALFTTGPALSKADSLTPYTGTEIR